LFIALETSNYLNLLAEIATRRHRREHRAAVIYNGHLQTLRPEYERGNRDQKGGSLLWHLEVDLGIGASEQLTGWIVDVNLSCQGASGEVDCP